MPSWIPAGLLALGAGSLGAWWVARYGEKVGLVAVPGDRSSHSRPTPSGGGIGILGFFVGASLYLNLSVLFWAGVTALSLVSLVDDRRPIRPRYRLLVHFAVAALAIWSLLPLGEIFGTWMPPAASLALAAVFLVGSANFFNFMDGINGIAGICAAIAFALLGVYGSAHPVPGCPPTLAYGLSLACVGFLPWNMPKSRVFMGDVASVLLGFVLAYFFLGYARSISEFALLCSFILPFYLDELVTKAGRMLAGHRFTSAHRQHLYQVLVNEGGIAHWKVSVGFGGIQLVCALGGWWLHARSTWLIFPFLAAVSLVWIGVDRKIKKRLWGKTPQPDPS